MRTTQPLRSIASSNRAADILKVEFQGGEPLLSFDRIRSMVEAIQLRNRQRRQIEFVITSTLHLITEAQLDFCREHSISLSTSLDGPAWLHDRNRPNPDHRSHANTLTAIDRVQRALGEDSVSDGHTARHCLARRR